MKDIHLQFVYYGKQAKYWLRKCEMLLPEIARLGVWRKKGFGSIYEYAAKLAGMNHEKVNDCLRIMKHISDKLELLKVAEEKGLGAVSPVAVVATKEDAGFWAEKVSVMSRHTLVTYVKEVCSGTDLPTSVTVTLKPELARRFEQFRKRADFEELIEKFMDEVENEPKPEPVKSESHYIPKEIKVHVATKTNGRCAYPGCDRLATEFHHTKRFALDYTHDPDAIVGLCKEHHQLAHCGLIENEEKRPYEWKLRTEPDKTDPRYRIDQLVMNYRGS
jgi:hypothetical protein